LEQSTNYPDIPNKSVLRPDEVAKVFGVTRRTVYNWHSEGKLEGQNKTGKCLRFCRETVIRFIGASS